MKKHINSQGEMVSIQDLKLDGKPVKCLVIHDDPPPRGSGQQAPTLLDVGLSGWLEQEIAELNPQGKTAAMHLALKMLLIGVAQIDSVTGEFCFRGHRYTVGREPNWTKVIDAMGWEKCRTACERGTA